MNRTPLDGLQPRGNGCYANGKAVIHARPYHGIEGELELANVADSNSAGAGGDANHRIESVEGAILDVTCCRYVVKSFLHKC